MRLAAPTRLLAVALLVAAPFAAAQDILADVGLPQTAPPRGVLDLGGMLGASAVAELEDLALRYKAGSKHEVLVVTVPTLKQRAIEDVARQIGRDWKLGERDEHDAAVLLLARDEREIRIEVGRGLEGSVTDAVSARIIRNVIVPRFKEGDFGGGAVEGVKAIHAAAGGEYAEIPHERPISNTLAPIVSTLVIFLIIFVIFVLSNLGRGGRRRRGGSVLPFPLGFPGGIGGPPGGFGGGIFGGGGFGGGIFGGGGFGGGGFGGGGFGGGGGGFSGGGASGRW